MTTTAVHTAIPGYATGSWDIDPAHSDVAFAVRHMVVSKVRGRFNDVTGEIVTAGDPLASSVTATIDLASIDTGNSQRDDHIRSADFFGVAEHPTMTYRGTGVRQDDEGFLLEGELTLKGVTRRVPLRLEVGGFGPDPYGGTRAGFTATGEINRRDFGVNWNAVMDTGGAVVSDKVAIALEIEAVLRPRS